MSVSFFNIKTGEERALSDPAHIAAFVNSSNLGKNANAGQDFKWRVSPELMAKVDEYSEDPVKLTAISVRLGVPSDALEVVHVLAQIAYEDDMAVRAQRRAAEANPVHAAAYEERLEKARNKVAQPAPAVRSSKPTAKK